MHDAPVLLPILPRILAYLDPGSGSIIIQLAIAAVLGLGVLVRSQWSRIKSLFGKKDANNDETDSEE